MILEKYTRPAPTFNGEDSLSYYVRAVNQFPVLTEEDETEIVALWVNEGNQRAGSILINCHLRLAVKIAVSYEGYELPRVELISEGNLGLVLALQNYNPAMGARFSTYATWWIHAQIKQHILQNWSLVKIGTTRAQKLLFFSFRKMKAKIQGEDFTGALSDEQIATLAKDLGVAVHEVRNIEGRLEKRDFSLNTPLGQDEDDEGEHMDNLEDYGPDPESICIDKDQRHAKRTLVFNLMSRLNEREKQIVADRILREKPLTLEVVGEKFGISRERVRQIEAQSLRKMQAAVALGRISVLP